MRAIGLLLLLAGCRQLLGFEEPKAAPDDAVVDTAPPPDASACRSLESSCAGDVLRECTAIGELPVETTCNWGCLDDDVTPHCGVLVPSGGVVVGTDLVDQPELLEIVAAAPLAIDTDNGQITGVRDAGTGIRNGIEFVVRGNVGVFRAKSFRFAGDVAVTGNRAFVMVATTGDLELNASVDLTTECTTQNRTPGGSQGGGGSGNGNGNGAGGRGTRIGGGGGSWTGGGGAGYGAAGGRGGNAAGEQGGDPGAAFGGLELALAGGSGGGGGAGDPSSAGGRGGAGGGAIQLVSNTRITISSGINAGGCGGRIGMTGESAGGGGGSGGAILLEAPVVMIAGSIAANGGGGASGGTMGSAGQHGRLAVGRADGGTTAGAEAADGGDGGSAGNSEGSPGGSARRAGGGGGAAGRIRLETRSGVASIGGFTSPGLDDTTNPAVQARATVQ